MATTRWGDARVLESAEPGTFFRLSSCHRLSATDVRWAGVVAASIAYDRVRVGAL